MDFKEILPESFFNLFQSKNRYLYVECLVRIYERYENCSILGMPKDLARDIVEEVLTEYHIGLDAFEGEEDETDEFPDIHEEANYFLRRIEKCGWITIDVDNDYQEILNFNDYAITLVLAFIEIKKDSSYSLFADNFTLNNEEKAFKGYIFTIYSLLNSTSYDYGLILNQVYKNTVQFVREIRKVDHKLKEFIQLIERKENIKELVELLSEYKDEVMDKAYFKLKTFDNINKYKLDIIKKLERMQEDPDVMAIIANDYLFLSGNDGVVAKTMASKQINDCIDIYNSIDSIMDEIDKKNRDYITQTLSKVKYLLNDATDVAAELNMIIKHYSDKVKQGKADGGFNDIKSVFDLNVMKYLTTSSLSVPRGTYKKSEANILPKTKIDISKFGKAFIDSIKSMFSEEDVINELNETVKPGMVMTCRDFVSDDMDKNDVIRIVFMIIYASGIDEFIVREEPDYVETKKFLFKNFTIERRMK